MDDTGNDDDEKSFFLLLLKGHLCRNELALKEREKIRAENKARLVSVFKENPDVLNFTIELLHRKQPKDRICSTFYDAYDITISTKDSIDVVNEMTGARGM